jgi:hypothetical protein
MIPAVSAAGFTHIAPATAGTAGAKTHHRADNFRKSLQRKNSHHSADHPRAKGNASNLTVSERRSLHGGGDVHHERLGSRKAHPDTELASSTCAAAHGARGLQTR